MITVPNDSKRLLFKLISLTILSLCFYIAASLNAEVFAQSCPKPSTNDFEAVDITYNKCYFECRLTGTDYKYDYRWRRKNTSNWSDLTATSEHRREINNLQEKTWYQYQCRLRCGDNWGSWSNTREFRTTERNGNNNCDRPGDSDYDAVDISYDHCYMECYIGGSTEYDYQWRREGTNTWTSLNGNSFARRKVENLRADTWYEYECRYRCNGQWTAWSNHKRFKTTNQGDVCNRPNSNEYDAVDISYDHAYLECYIGGYPKYDYRWRKKGGSWKNLTANNFWRRKIDNLDEDTWYEYECRYECNDQWTDWSNYKEFKTGRRDEMNCNRPIESQYNAVDIGGDEAYLECYISGSSRYDYRWRKKGTTSWKDLTASQESRRKIDMLDADSWYQYQCRYDCGGEFTSWSNIKEFKTIDQNNNCAKPGESDYDAVDIDVNQAYLECYIAGSSNYDYRWRKEGSNDWEDLMSTDEHRRKIDNLTANTWYEYQCRYNCGGGLTDWSDNKRFKTLEEQLECAAPSSDQFGAVDISANVAYLECYVAGSPSYDFRYRRQGTNDWTDLESSSDSRRLIEDLNSETTYEYQARYECGDQFGPWAESKTFTTESASSLSCVPPTSADLSTSQASENSATLNCIVSGFTGYQYRYRDEGSQDWTTLEVAEDAQVTVEELNSGTTYEFQCRLTCADDTQSDWSETARFATLGSTAVITITDAEWTIAPNPARETLWVSGRQGTLRIYNMIGALVHTYEVNQGDQRHALSLKVSPGLYTVTLQDKDDFGSKKLLVQ